MKNGWRAVPAELNSLTRDGRAMWRVALTAVAKSVGLDRSSGWRGGVQLFIATVAFVLAGCAATYPMMPPPALYTGAQARPLFTDLPADDQKPPLDLLYITDRAPSTGTDPEEPYTSERARSIAFGSTTVEFGAAVPWDVLVKESTTMRRGGLELTLGPTRELGRFPPIPYEIAVVPGGIARKQSIIDAHEQAKRTLQSEIERRLVDARRKEVVLFIHGYNNTFEDAAVTMGELCHYMGRDFVCGIFTWPAGGRRGILFGYNVDRESGEYAVEDLRKTIRIVAQTPGVEKIHFIAHSRGNDVLATALAELAVEAYGLGRSLAQQFHIANVVLAAPDIDADVALSKIFKVFSDPDLPFRGAPDPGVVLEPQSRFNVTIYVSPDDKALATSSWLSGSFARLGRIDAKMLTSHEIDEIRMLGAVDVVQVRGKTDFFGHDYFVSNPEVSSDIIAVLRYGHKPNEPGRPLQPIDGPFWAILPADSSAATN